MYSVVLMAALTTGAETPACWGHSCHGCQGSACYGCYGGWGCDGNTYGGCYGCYGYGGGHGAHGGYSGCYGGYSGCYGGCFGTPYGCHGCYGCYGCNGCTGYAPGATPYMPPAAATGPATAPPTGGADTKPPTGKSGGGPEGMGAASPRARLIVELPADAKLYIDDHLMKTMSEQRTFNTPVLDQNQAYYYVVRAEVVRDGKTHSDTRRIIIRAGDEIRMAFTEAEIAGTAKPKEIVQR